MSYWSDTTEGKAEIHVALLQAEALLEGLLPAQAISYTAKNMKLINHCKRIVQGVDYVAKSGNMRKPKKRIEWLRKHVGAIFNYYNANIQILPGHLGKKFEMSDPRLSTQKVEMYDELIVPSQCPYVLAYCTLYWNNFTEIFDKETLDLLSDKTASAYSVWSVLKQRIANMVEMLEIDGVYSQSGIYCETEYYD